MSRHPAKDVVLKHIEESRRSWSQWHAHIFDLAETAWREHQSCAWYADRLEREGFAVERGSGGMPTAFCATWSNGDGPTVGGYAEYDAVPGNCQAADVVQRPRDGLGIHAAGHTDPHSALGIAALTGFLAAKDAMVRHQVRGTLKFFGEPAEKVRGSKPIHAARGYYDDLDAAISFHPFYMLPLCNTTRWDTHCAAAYAMIYTFECREPETWRAASVEPQSPIAASHASPRAPGADHALVRMFSSSDASKAGMLPPDCQWSMNECILTAGQATADNLPARLAQIQYIVRAPTLELADRVLAALDHNAEQAALASHCSWRRDWVSRSRPGLPNHVMAELAFDNLRQVGAPRFNAGEALGIAQSIQRNLGLTPMERPFLAETEALIEPKAAETELRRMLPDWQRHFTSDDYTEYCWHAPTVRLYVARPTLSPPEPGYAYPAWAMNALGGIPATIDPMIDCAGKTIGCTVIDLLTRSDVLAAATREFETRTGGGVGGNAWIAPQCDYAPPIDFRWPDYRPDADGRRQWWIGPLPWEGR